MGLSSPLSRCSRVDFPLPLGPVMAVKLPAVEVHLSDVDAREPFRHVSYAGMACQKTFKGLGFEGYRRALRFLCGFDDAE